MNIVAWAVIGGAFIGGALMWLAVSQPSNGDPSKVSDEWLKGNIYDRGKDGY